MASPAYVRLLDLPPDLLARIGAQLTFEERLRLSLVCRRWRDVCSGPSELWSTVDASIRFRISTAFADVESNPGIPDFVSWFTKRAQAVEQLSLDVANPTMLAMSSSSPIPIPASLLHDGGGPRLPLPLRKFALSYRGRALLDFSGGDMRPADWLPVLQKVALFHVELVPAPPRMHQAPPRLTDLSLITGWPHALDAPHGWLPSSLTALVCSSSYLPQLPLAVARLMQLRSLVLDDNDLGFDRDEQGVGDLTSLGQLEELNLSTNPLGRLPPQLTALRHLRILYLHHITLEGPMPLEAWEPLRACTALAFLSISLNELELLPPAVADMTHLQALHCEENNMPSLPVAPYLSSLRELLVDWRTLMARPVFLRAATQLTRLILHRFVPAVPPAGGEGPLGPPAGAGEVLLAELAAMPALRRVDDVYEEGASTHLVTAGMAHVMWQLGKRCPHLQFEQPCSSNLGWTLTSLVAELPHNAGNTVLEG